jgi:hypothetical protein
VLFQLGSPQTGWRCWLQHWQQRLRLYFARDLTRNCTQNFTPEREGERGNVRSLQPNSFCHTFDAPVQSALQAVGQYLMQQGFKLGQDFSLTEGGILLNQNTSDHLKVKLGTTHFEEVLAGAPGLLQRSPGVALEKPRSPIRGAILRQFQTNYAEPPAHLKWAGTLSIFNPFTQWPLNNDTQRSKISRVWVRAIAMPGHLCS